MNEEDYICARYREAANKKRQLKILEETTCFSTEKIAEILTRHGYPVKVKPKIERHRAPRNPSQGKTQRQIAQENKAKRAAIRAEQNTKIKEMLEQGLPQTEIAVRVKLSPSAIFYRKMEIYEPEKYKEHLLYCCMRQKKAAK